VTLVNGSDYPILEIALIGARSEELGGPANRRGEQPATGPPCSSHGLIGDEKAAVANGEVDLAPVFGRNWCVETSRSVMLRQPIGTSERNDVACYHAEKPTPLLWSAPRA